jgi:excinuclease ABC subunit A
VGTATEVFTYLRVLFARLGHRPCPACGADIPPAYDEGEELSDEPEDLPVESFGEQVPCPACGAPVPEMGMAHFSFNKPAGACPSCTGLGVVTDANLPLLVDEEKSIMEGAVRGWDIHSITRYATAMQLAGRYYGFTFDPDLPVRELGQVQRDLLLHGVGGERFRRHFPEMEPPQTVGTGRFEGVVTNLLRRYAERIHDADYREKMEKLLVKQRCPECEGSRLRKESRQVTVAGESIVALARLPLDDLAAWMEALPAHLSSAEQSIAAPIVADLRDRIRRLIDVGVGYLTLDRTSPTLSAGEAQRLRLASLLGSGLTGVLYVLDEPTIGLHQRDTERLIAVLRRLRDLGNTVVVVEHDLELIRAADHIIDVGPGAGEAGGWVVAAGTPAEVAAVPKSATGRCLLAGSSDAVRHERRRGNGERLTIHEAREHNLQGITVSLPLGTFVAVTGVSGSGKSSLMLDVFDRAARRHFYGAQEPPGAHSAIEGWEQIDKVVTIDQSAIGRTPRSNAATYTDAFTPIRRTFAGLPEAAERGLTARHFSFNVPGGRCERCQGSGVLTVNMHFLPDVEVRCPACRGRRFSREVLEVKYRDHSIADVLELTIEAALPVFAEVAPVASRLQLLIDVGLGYLKLGQPATTFSGGEAQRIKLTKELARGNGHHTLYLLDEPTTGLHPADTARLLDVLQRLVDAGNSVVVIEHNLDVVRAADWIVDLGPEGGAAGGRLIAEGPPELVARAPESITGRYLR